MRLSRSVTFAISALAGLVMVAHAQQNKITLSGTVRDSSGAVVPGVELTISVEHCKCADCKPKEPCDCCPPQLKVHSNGDGEYSLTIPHGTYRIDAKSGSHKAHMSINLDDGTAKTQHIQIQ
jgi:hypothetical protein